MIFKLYFLELDGKKQLNTVCVKLPNGDEHITADIRHTYSSKTEVTIGLSKITHLENNQSSLESLNDLMELDVVELREIDVEPIETDIKPYGISWVIFDAPEVDPSYNKDMVTIFENGQMLVNEGIEDVKNRIKQYT